MLENWLQATLQICLKQAIITRESVIRYRLKKNPPSLTFLSIILMISNENKLSPSSNRHGKVFFYTPSRRKDDVRTPQRDEGVIFGGNRRNGVMMFVLIIAAKLPFLSAFRELYMRYPPKIRNLKVR